MFLRNDLFLSIIKNGHLHNRVNLDLGMKQGCKWFRMSKNVSGLEHMVLVALGFLLVVFEFK